MIETLSVAARTASRIGCEHLLALGPEGRFGGALGVDAGQSRSSIEIFFGQVDEIDARASREIVSPSRSATMRDVVPAGSADPFVLGRDRPEGVVVEDLDVGERFEVVEIGPAVARLALDGEDVRRVEEARRAVGLDLAAEPDLVLAVALDIEDLAVAGVGHVEDDARSVGGEGGRADPLGGFLEDDGGEGPVELEIVQSRIRAVLTDEGERPSRPPRGRATSR